MRTLPVLLTFLFLQVAKAEHVEIYGDVTVKNTKSQKNEERKPASEAEAKDIEMSVKLLNLLNQAKNKPKSDNNVPKYKESQWSLTDDTSGAQPETDGQEDSGSKKSEGDSED